MSIVGITFNWKVGSSSILLFILLLPQAPIKTIPSENIHKESPMKIYEYFIDLFQKEPVGTEFNAYKLLKEIPLDSEENYLAMPWVVLINSNKLDMIPDINLNGGFTICQHIHFEKILPILRKIGINVLFTPHAIKNKYYDGIKVLPFPHFAINGTKPAKHKDLWYSFVGFNTHPSRTTIFNMPKIENVIIEERTNWHFYLSALEQEQAKLEYQDLLARSRFSLCPRGTGASTLRFWESLQAGAIPILIADEMTLPDGVDWKECIIQIAEKNVLDIHTILSKISPEKEKVMRNNCLKAYDFFSSENLVNNIRLYFATRE